MNLRLLLFLDNYTAKAKYFHNGEPRLPRFRKQLDNDLVPHRFASPKEYFRLQYSTTLYRILARICITNEFEDRFGQDSYRPI